MRKALALLAMSLFMGSTLFAQTDETKLFPESIDPAVDYRPTEVLLPQSPLSMQILFIGGYDSVETRAGRALAKQWHDFIGFTPAGPGETGMGWVSVNHERIVADDRIGDGGGMTVFKVERAADGTLQIMDQNLNDGRAGKYFNVQFENVGETGMNCAGITSLADGRIWTAEEWFRSSVNSIYQGGNGIRDTSDFTISTPEFPGFDGQTIKKVDNMNYMVEIDPRNAEAVRKQYNWGRGGWEGGVVMPDNKTVYLGEDARPGLFTRFVADNPGDFTSGTYSYYAYDEATETAYWKDYEITDIEDAANLSASNGYADGARTFRGAPFVGDSAAAMFIRNEWVAAYNGRVYWAETGNQGFWNEFTDYRLHKSSPTSIADYNGNGYNGKIGNWHLEAARFRFPDLKNVSNDSVREWLTASQNFTDAHGRILCYDPATSETHVFLEGGPYPGDGNSSSVSVNAGYPEKHLSNPDGLNFITTPQGKTFMIICEDLNQSSYNSVPAEAQGNRACELWALDMDLAEDAIAQAQAMGKPIIEAISPSDLIRISTTPIGSEVTGAQQTSDGKTLLVNSQHPSTSNPFPFNNSLTYAIHGWDKLAELAERRVAKLKVYENNGSVNTEVMSGDTVYIDNLSGRDIRFEAIMEPEIINGSVFFDITGPVNSTKQENYFRYITPVAGGAPVQSGTYTVTIIPNDQLNRAGNDGIPRTYEVTLMDTTVQTPASPVVGLNLYENAGSVFASITDGDTVYVSNVPSRDLRVEVLTNPQIINGSLFIDIQGPVNSTKVENYFRYIAPLGGTAAPMAGTYTVTVTPYDQPGATGNAGTPVSFTFTVMDSPSGMREATSAPAVAQFNVYPNPVMESLNFNKMTSVAIYNELGQRIAVYENVKTINVNDFRQKIGSGKTFFVMPSGGEKAVRIVLED
ncbi:MAG: alkaline phosphatase PhoX [Bacteroidota bacterium]